MTIPFFLNGRLWKELKTLHRGCSGEAKKVWMEWWVCEKCNCMIHETLVDPIEKE